MGHNQIRSEGSKPESFDSRIRMLDDAMRQVCEAVLEMEARPSKARAKLLAVLGALGHDGSEMFTRDELNGEYDGE